MLKPWSISTAVRSADRLRGFLSVLAQMEGMAWNHAAQESFQIRLIQALWFMDDLTQSDIGLVVRGRKMSYWRATAIFKQKNYANPPARARKLFAPMEKLGLASLTDGKIRISELGKLFLAEEKDYEFVYLSILLNWQIPNPFDRVFSAAKGYNIKPFIGVLRLISAVNRLSKKFEGISAEEFTIFGTTLIDHRNIEKTAEEIIKFRAQIAKITDAEKDGFIKEAAARFRPGFDLRHAPQLSRELVWVFIITKFINAGQYYEAKRINLSPYKMPEICAITDSQSGEPEVFATVQEHINYIGKIWFLPPKSAINI